MARPPLLTRAFVLIFVAHFFHGLSIQSFVHLPGLIEELGGDEFMIGLVVGTMPAAAIAVRPAVGRAIDLRGRRIVLLTGGVINAAACLLYLTIDALGPWVFVVRLFHGIAGAMLFSVLFTVAADLVPEDRRTQGLAIFGIGGMIPFAIGGVLGDVLLAHGDYADLFLATAAAAAAGVVASVPLPDSRPALRSSDASARPFLDTATDPALLRVWLVFFGFALGFASYFTFIKTFVLHTGLGSVGLFFTTYASMAVGVRVFFGWVPDRIGPKRVLFPALAAVAAGLYVLAGAEVAAHVGIAGLLCGIGHGYVFPVLISMGVSRARRAERGAAIALLTAVHDVGLLLGGPLLGLIVRESSYPVMFTTAAAIVAIGAIVFAVSDRD